MNDPYTTLGVSRDASDADIKKAYRELVRKYHPDNYADNPLADLAQEKMKEINEAYDAITKMRSGQSNAGYSGGSGSGYTNTGYTNTGYSGGSSVFYNVRSAINSGDLGRAEQLLAASSTRNAEWNFLMGSVYYKRGWLDEARQYFSVAVSMEPNNAEYRQAMDHVNSAGYPYSRSGYGPPANAGSDMCDICTAMMCANMLCRCR